MGGFKKMEKLCGIVWTQNGGEIRKSGCDMNIKIKIKQNVCVWNGVFPYKESPCSATIFTKSTRIVWDGDFISNSIQRKIVLGHPH